jgi:hypothetical protein
MSLSIVQKPGLSTWASASKCSNNEEVGFCNGSSVRPSVISKVGDDPPTATGD